MISVLTLAIADWSKGGHLTQMKTEYLLFFANLDLKHQNELS